MNESHEEQGRRRDEALRVLRKTDDNLKAEIDRHRAELARLAHARRAAAIHARTSGLTAHEIANELGVSLQRTYQLFSEDDEPRRQPPKR
jgi:DNA-directed RNA polymerase specialized sigma24 family protein